MTRMTMLTPALLLLAACELEPMNDVGSVGDTGGTSTGGASTGGADPGGAATGGSGSDGTGGGGAAECAAFEDAPGWSVQVLIRNDSSQTLHLGQSEVTCRTEPLFQVLSTAGVLAPEAGDCDTPCDAVMQGDPLGCLPICLFPQARTLAPGDAAEVMWTTRYGVPSTLPAECRPEGTEPLACIRAAALEPGDTVTLRVTAGTSVDCTETTGECAACEPNEHGGCTTQAALLAGTMLTAEATVTLGPSYGVGPVNGGGALQPIEIFFTD